MLYNEEAKCFEFTADVLSRDLEIAMHFGAKSVRHWCERLQKLLTWRDMGQKVIFDVESGMTKAYKLLSLTRVARKEQTSEQIQ